MIYWAISWIVGAAFLVALVRSPWPIAIALALLGGIYLALVGLEFGPRFWIVGSAFLVALVRSPRPFAIALSLLGGIYLALLGWLLGPRIEVPCPGPPPPGEGNAHCVAFAHAHGSVQQIIGAFSVGFALCLLIAFVPRFFLRHRAQPELRPRGALDISARR